jgi:hypothetical protein
MHVMGNDRLGAIEKYQRTINHKRYSRECIAGNKCWRGERDVRRAVEISLEKSFLN